MRLLIALLSLFAAGQLMAQQTNPQYDAELAARLGADDYGMKKFVLVLLKTGSNTTSHQDSVSTAFRGHMNNIEAMVKAGKLLVAGPVMEQSNGSYRGIFILNVQTEEEALELLAKDPAISKNFLHPELYFWYGSAALGEYLPAAEKIWKIKP